MTRKSHFLWGEKSMLGDSGEQLETALVPTEVITSDDQVLRPKAVTTDLNEVQLEFCRLKALGFKGHEIRDRLGISKTTYSKMNNDPACMGFIEETLADIVESTRTKIRDLTSEAFDVLRGLLYSDNDQVRLGAVREVMDRSGLKPAEKKIIFNQFNTNVLTDEEIVDRLRLLEGERR